MNHPEYSFGSKIGPSHAWFAWKPVKLFYGNWAWLRHVSRQMVQKKGFLDGPDWSFWSYTDIDERKGKA